MAMPVTMTAIKKRCAELIAENKFNEALECVHDCVEKIVTNPICAGNVFGSKILDEICEKIASCVYDRFVHGAHPVSHVASRPLTVFIVTKVHSSGGHSRVIRDFIDASPDAHHLVMATGVDGKSDFSVFAGRSNVEFETAPRGNYLEKLIWLQTRLRELRPGRVYLFNGHQDSVAVAAVPASMNLECYFYHHADHHLCLGLYLRGVKHIDPHPFGYFNCKQKLGIDSCYLPFSVRDFGKRSSDHGFLKSGTLVTCTAARSNKVELPYFVNYVDVIPDVICRTGGRHIHIGTLSRSALQKIRSELKRRNIDLGRFVYIPFVSSIWKALHEHEVDVYLASFPIGAGLTLIEAMGAGVPIVLHKHIYCSALGSQHLAYPGVYSWHQPDELLDYLGGLDGDRLEALSQAGRLHYETYFCGDHIKDFVRTGDFPPHEPILMDDDFAVDTEEWACWVEGQQSLGRLAYIALHRGYRRLRAKFNF